MQTDKVGDKRTKQTNKTEKSEEDKGGRRKKRKGREEGERRGEAGEEGGGHDQSDHSVIVIRVCESYSESWFAAYRVVYRGR